MPYNNAFPSINLYKEDRRIKEKSINV